MKKIMAMLLAVVLLLQPTSVLAQEVIPSGKLCEHHDSHSIEICGTADLDADCTFVCEACTITKDSGPENAPQVAPLGVSSLTGLSITGGIGGPPSMTNRMVSVYNGKLEVTPVGDETDSTTFQWYKTDADSITDGEFHLRCDRPGEWNKN